MTTWILLRGLTRESRHWGGFPAELQASLGDADIVALDLPGAGDLNGETSPTRIEDIARHCHEQAIARALRPPFNIVALSLGAMVATAWANQHPDEIEACVLINTSLRPFCPFWRRLRPRNYPTLLRLALPAADRTREAAIYDMTCKNQATREAAINDWVAICRLRPVSVANALRQLYAATRYSRQARPPTRHLLVLASQGDTLVDPECSKRLVRAWETAFAEHPNAGHDLPQDDPDWVAARIAEWWSEILRISAIP